MSEKRGIVISQQFEVGSKAGISEKLSDTIVTLGGNPSPADLRKYLLYWDVIDYPDNNLTPIAPDPDMQFLISTGVVTRTYINFGNLKISLPEIGYVVLDPSVQNEFMVMAQISAFDKHNKENQGIWSLAQLSTKLHLLSKTEAPKAAVEYELYNMLPVPTADVPLNDILEFKQKHHDELVALHGHLDDVYQKIISSADIPRAKDAELNRLELSLNDIDKALSNFGINKKLTSLRGYISGELPGATSLWATLTGLSETGYAPFIALPSPVVGAIGTGIVFAVKAIVSPKAEKGSHPLIYISSMRKDEPTWR